MATKLSLLNGALLEIGNETLSDTGEDVKAGRVLNAVYDDVLTECLAAGSWNFATKTVQLDSDTGVSTNFGYAEVFAKPADWVATVAISADENFSAPLLHYFDDANYWSADVSPIYARYVSNDTSWGLNLTAWPIRFVRYVVLELASRVITTLTQGASDKKRIDDERDRARRYAKNQDSMNEPQPKFAPAGSWTTARGRMTGRERGSRGRLTG